MSVTLGQFNGNPTITLLDDSTADERIALKMTFGRKKAELIVKHYDQIVNFLEVNKKPKQGGTNGMEAA